MAACTKTGEIYTGTDEDQVEIKLKSTALSIDVATKAPFDGTIGTPAGNNLTARVIASTATGNYATANVYADGNMTFTNDGTNEVGYSGTKYYYPANDDLLYFCGLYPATASWTALGTTTSLTFSGTEDAMAAAETSGQKSTAQAGTHPALAFKHLLTKLVIKVVAEDAAAITAWGNITGITLTAANGATTLRNQVAVDLKAGAAATTTAFSGTGTSFPFYGTRSDAVLTSYTLTSTAVEIAYSMVAPIVATGTDDFTLNVKTVNNTTGATVKLALTSGDTQGKSYTITLTFKATEIKATATVTDWVDVPLATDVI